jgi:hypothetical protein
LPFIGAWPSELGKMSSHFHLFLQDCFAKHGRFIRLWFPGLINSSVYVADAKLMRTILVSEFEAYDRSSQEITRLPLLQGGLILIQSESRG